MDEALHLFVVERHDSLFVQDGQEIVGLILFADIYKKIRETMKSYPLPIWFFSDLPQATELRSMASVGCSLIEKPHLCLENLSGIS